MFMIRIIASTFRPRLGTKFGLCLVGIASMWLLPAKAAHSAEPTDATAKKSEKDPRPVETVVLETKDGLQMEADYYPSKKGKNAVPIVMLHGWKGSRADFAKLALQLQKDDYPLAAGEVQQRGHAIIVPDLRGHGKSTVIKMGQDSRSIDQSLMKKGDFDAMVIQDMEAVKRFLIEKNNNQELNIEKLCVVGADMGAVVAMNWAVRDWSAPKLLTGKQGQDVKALVLISPPMNFRGITVAPALNTSTLQSDLSVLVIAGQEKGGKPFADAQAIHKRLGQTRPKPPTDPQVAAETQDLFFDGLPTSLQGTKILEDRKLEAQVSFDIGQFIELRLVNKKFPWAVRKSALGE
jgi:pimeloyl-ACP methyl ester carboxylesterase